MRWCDWLATCRGVVIDGERESTVPVVEIGKANTPWEQTAHELPNFIM